jgi:hypothetical protein
MSISNDSQAPRIVPMDHRLIRCDNCGYIDRTYKFGDFGGYGRALGRTCSGELAEFSAWEDPVYEELLEIVSIFMPQGGKRRDCFNMVMSLAADPSPQGERYKFIDNLCCRQCGSTAKWYKVAEPDVERIHLPLVTHREWKRLSREEKVNQIEAGLRSNGCIE